MMNDTLANAMSIITNAEGKSRKTCLLPHASSTIKSVLDLMNKKGYIGKYTEEATSYGKSLKVELLGALNKCGAIKPRYTVKNSNLESYEKKFLPAKNFGFMVISTSQGMMTHTEAKQKSIGGKLIAFV